MSSEYDTVMLYPNQPWGCLFSAPLAGTEHRATLASRQNSPMARRGPCIAPRAELVVVRDPLFCPMPPGMFRVPTPCLDDVRRWSPRRACRATTMGSQAGFAGSTPHPAHSSGSSSRDRFTAFFTSREAMPAAACHIDGLYVSGLRAR